MEARINRLLQSLWLALESFSEWLADFVASLGGDSRKTKLDADFIKSTELLSRKHKGFCMDGLRSLSIEDSYKGALVFGPTGGGKSTCVLIPSCLRMIKNSSMIIHDPSGEIAAATQAAYYAAGYEVKTLNYMRPELSGFNPLARIRSLSDIKKVSSLIVFTALGRTTGDPFWNTSATMLLRILIQIVCSQPEEFRTMANVVKLIDVFSFKPQSLDALVVKANDPGLLAAYKSVVATDAKLLASITATVKAAAETFLDPEVALCTSYDSIDFDAFRSKPTVLFINNSVTDMKYYAVITSIFFTQFMGHIMRSIPPADAYPIFFLLDEASSLSLAGILPTAVSNVRKHRAGILQVYQSYHQLTSIYGHDEAKAIKENCYASLYLPGQNLETSIELSSLLGMYEFETERGSTKQRQLLMPDEVRELEEGLLIAGNHRAAKVKLHPFYKSPRLSRLTRLSVPPMTGMLPFDTPPLIPLP